MNFKAFQTKLSHFIETPYGPNGATLEFKLLEPDFEKLEELGKLIREGKVVRITIQKDTL